MHSHVTDAQEEEDSDDTNTNSTPSGSDSEAIGEQKYQNIIKE